MTPEQHKRLVRVEEKVDNLRAEWYRLRGIIVGASVVLGILWTLLATFHDHLL